MIGFCVNCDDERALRQEQREQSVTVRGEEIEFEASVRICSVCGETVFDQTNDESLLIKAYDMYRTRHGLLTSTEIQELREQYRLSQRSLARLLDWGLVTIQRYERGALQDAAHDQVLRSLYDPRQVLKLLQNAEGRLPRKLYDGAVEAATELLTGERPGLLVQDVESLLEPGASSVNHGFRTHDSHRVSEAVLLFATHLERLTKTKLAKLLWLADFKHFRRHRSSITGLAYARLPYGPVPDRFQLWLAIVEELGNVRIVEERFGQYQGEVIKPLKSHDERVFEAAERDTLLYVIDTFGDLSATELSNLSHAEAAWLDRSDGEIIPYTEADRLEIFA